MSLDEEWGCVECGHTETSPVDELAGREVEKDIVGDRRQKTITTVVCPRCGSDNWHSETVRDALLS